jgi:hypothetical protein
VIDIRWLILFEQNLFLEILRWGIAKLDARAPQFTHLARARKKDKQCTDNDMSDRTPSGRGVEAQSRTLCEMWIFIEIYSIERCEENLDAVHIQGWYHHGSRLFWLLIIT